MTFSILAGCSKNEVETKIQTLSQDNLEAEFDGGKIKISSLTLEEEAECSIEKVEVPPVLGEIEADAYNFSIDTEEELAGVLEIVLPYDKSKIEEGMTVAESVGAGYYNEETKAWEPVVYEINEEDETITITTDHLSIYGAFIVNNENTRAAKVICANQALFTDSNSMEDYIRVINEAIDNNMQPGSSALELGTSWISSSFSDIGVVLTFEEGIYGSAFATNMSNAFTNLGLGVAIAQAAVDLSNGDQAGFVYNALKNGANFAISKWGSYILRSSFVGVYFIDYALSSFLNEAKQGRKDIYSEAYKLYYEQEGEAKRSPKDWYKIMLALTEQAKSTEELNDIIMQEVDKYCNMFWQDETMVAFYQDKAMENGFTGGGGLNEEMKKEISENHKYELFTGYLQPVFAQIGKKLKLQQQQEVTKQLDLIKDELNKVMTINIVDTGAEEKKEKSKYSGYTARIAPLSDNVEDPEKWATVIDDQGKCTLKFRILGHVMAGKPTQIELVPPGEETAEKTLDFIVEPPELTIDLKEEVPTLDELVGTWADSNMYIKDISISDSLIQMAENDTSENSEGCDLDVIAMIQELEGQTKPAQFNLVKSDENSGTVEFSGDDNILDGVMLNFTYENGVININVTMSQEETTAVYAATLKAAYEKSEGANNGVTLQGDLEIKVIPEGGEIKLSSDLKAKKPLTN
ncbi:hypothetical protein [Clostridium sp. DL1XJH146]